jgi:hypothetical protein
MGLEEGGNLGDGGEILEVMTVDNAQRLVW